MNKKILFGIIFSLAILVILGMLFILFRQNNVPSGPPDKYTIAFSSEKGVHAWSLLVGNKQSQLSDAQINQYINTSFNSIGDVIWVNCIDTYNTSDVTSRTKNNLVYLESVGTSMEILENQKNEISLVCTKK